jgi:hypothetical protein
LLDLLLAAPDQDAAAAEREMADVLSEKPWLRVVSSGGEAAVAVSRTRRVIDTRSESKDGKQTTIRFKYVVSAGIAISGDRGTIEAEMIVARNYSISDRQHSPSRSEDRDAFERAGRVAGTASGTLTLNGKSVPLRYAYAMAQPNTFDASKNDTAILLTEKPLPEGAIDEIGDLQEAAHDVIRGRKHEGMAYFKLSSTGKPIYELSDHPALLSGQYRQIQMSGFTHADFAPKQMGPDRVEGPIATGF